MLGGRNRHGDMCSNFADTMDVNAIPIPSMRWPIPSIRWKDRSLTYSDYEWDKGRIMKNFKHGSDALVFLGCECQSKYVTATLKPHQAMTSFWTTWKLFCDLSKQLKLDDDQNRIAIFTQDSDILDDVRMEGFKHCVEVGCLSCAFGQAMPDGRILCEKWRIRATGIRVQDFPTSECHGHVHTSQCRSRKSKYTGVDELLRMIACDIRDKQTMHEYRNSEACACAIRLNEGTRQRWHKTAIVRSDNNVSFVRELCSEKLELYDAISEPFHASHVPCSHHYNPLSSQSDISFPTLQLVAPGYVPGYLRASVPGPRPDSDAMASPSASDVDQYPEFQISTDSQIPFANHIARPFKLSVAAKSRSNLA